MTTCSCTFADPYWSSTTYAGNPDRAVMVDVKDGNPYKAPKTFGGGYVRAVRDL